jgi:GNAT superfamily N-acetyltransferase
MPLPVVPALDGPHPITPGDIGAVNAVFSDAFTERYRRDGMVGVRVPTLNPAIWRYAIDDAGAGAMLWRDAHGDVVAFNVAHRSGTEGWMGPLAVRTPRQGAGVGTAVVRAGIAWLRATGATVVGLETMPRTMDNIGFYSRLGFTPGRLTVTVSFDAAAGPAPTLLGALGGAEAERARVAITGLTAAVAPGVDFTREVALTQALALGDVVLLWDGDTALAGWALCHAAPLVEGRAREELRVLKCVARDEHVLAALTGPLASYARHAGCRRVAVRVQGEFPRAYRALIDLGARVRWTDLRMTLDGAVTAVTPPAIVLSNWEI